MARQWISGIDDETYNYLFGLIGSGLNDFFAAATTKDENGKLFHTFIGEDQSDWYAFLVDGDFGIDPDEYGVGSFLVIKSTQGSGGL